MLRSSAKEAARAVAATLGPARWPGLKARLWILTYHRVLPPDDPRVLEEEPGMMVTPDTFRRQIRWLQQLFEIVPLSEWLNSARSGAPLPRKACAITFDDGWRDNYEYAWPILREAGAPATIFAVADMVDTEARFWPNRLAHLLRHADRGTMPPGSLDWLRELGVALGDGELDREDLTRAIHACKQLPDHVVAQHITETEKAAELPQTHARHVMNWSELREMAGTGLIEVGSHGCTHTRLSAETTKPTVEDEVTRSRSHLERELGSPVRLFCYPNGDVSPTALAMVSTHYEGAVTTRRGLNDGATSPHELRRLTIHEDATSNRRAFLARLSGWI